MQPKGAKAQARVCCNRQIATQGKQMGKIIKEPTRETKESRCSATRTTEVRSGYTTKELAKMSKRQKKAILSPRGKTVKGDHNYLLGMGLGYKYRQRSNRGVV